MSKFMNGWTRPRKTELLAAAGVLKIALVIVGQYPQAQEAELIIRNGLIVNDYGRMKADIRVRGEKIVEIAAKVTATAGAREIDAAGMLLMPGIIDTHTHLPLTSASRPPKGNQDNIITGGGAALAGGITSLGDFIAIRKDESQRVPIRTSP